MCLPTTINANIAEFVIHEYRRLARIQTRLMCRCASGTDRCYDGCQWSRGSLSTTPSLETDTTMASPPPMDPTSVLDPGIVST